LASNLHGGHAAMMPHVKDRHFESDTVTETAKDRGVHPT
jgi:hypothetical protein